MPHALNYLPFNINVLKKYKWRWAEKANHFEKNRSSNFGTSDFSPVSLYEKIETCQN